MRIERRGSRRICLLMLAMLPAMVAATMPERDARAQQGQAASPPAKPAASPPAKPDARPDATPQLHPRTAAEVEEAHRAARHLTVDVVVSDAAGIPVRSLEQKDFTLIDNGRPVAISAWHFMDGRRNLPRTEVILLLDALNPSFQDVGFMRQGIDVFLRRNGGQLEFPVSLIFLSDAGVSIEPASTDGNHLAAELRKLKTPLRLLDTAQGANGWAERLQQSVHALTELAAYERRLPGRKLLIWTGPGWPLLTGPAPSLNLENRTRFFSSIVELDTLLRQAHITLDNVIPLNLSTGTGLRSFLYQSYLKGVDNPQHADAPNLALQVFAIASGGLVLDKNGDLANQIARCVQDAEASYKISFEGEPAQHIDTYHRLEVRVVQPGLTARAITGYYAQP